MGAHTVISQMARHAMNAMKSPALLHHEVGAGTGVSHALVSCVTLRFSSLGISCPANSR